MAAEAKSEVLELIKKLSELELLDVATKLELKLSAKPKKDRKTALYNLLVRSITCEDIEDMEEEDQFKIFDQMLTLVKEVHSSGDEDEDEDEETKEKLKLEAEMLDKLEELKNMAGLSIGGPKFEAAILGGQSSVEEAVAAVKQQTSLPKVVSQKPDPKSNPSFAALSHNSAPDISTAIHRMKLKDFKLQGGTIGGESQLDYGDVCFQMRDGLASYTEEEVMRGVIKSTKPGCELRRFFERAQNMSIADFKSILRTHYRVRESSKIMDEMVANIQGPEQPLHKYVMKMMAYRDEILDVTKSEDCPLGEPLVRRRFTDSVLSGLRKPLLRLEVQAIIAKNLSDPVTLDEVEKVMTRDEENERKLGKSRAVAEAKAIGIDMAARKKESERQDAVERRLEALATQVQNLEVLLRGGKVTPVPDYKTQQEAADAKVAALMTQVQHLEAALQTYKKDTSDAKDGHQNQMRGGSRRRMRYQCATCKVTNSVCFHCKHCHEVGHYAAHCPKNV